MWPYPVSLIRLVVALMLSGGTAYATDFADTPSLGVGESYGPNVMLALSVEYPTAGAAYNTSSIGGTTTAISTSSSEKPTFYRIAGSGAATLTKSSFESNHYLGYFDQGKCYSYTGSGDSAYFTPVEQADSYGYCSNNNYYSGKLMNWLTMTAIDIYRLAMTGGNRALGLSNSKTNYQNGDTSGFTTLRRAYVNLATSGLGSVSRNGTSGIGSRLVAADLLNTGKVFPLSNLVLENGALRIYNSDFRMGFYQCTTSSCQSSTLVPRNVVVQACKSGMLEDNCAAYGSSYKPEGLMQENIDDMRFGVVGYLNNISTSDNAKSQDGGILRARMKSLWGETTANGLVLGSEVSKTDGTFTINPDTADAANSSVSNSGVINYLNKFGDSGIYRNYDPGGELFYTALRYLRGKSSLSGYNKYAQYADARDNFPAITDWNDPLLVQGETVASAAAVCRPNYVMYIGDTNTHYDNAVPNFYSNDGWNPTDDNEVKTLTYLTNLLSTETYAKSFSPGNNVGANASHASITGLAYWARTNDIRTDVSDKQYLHSIFIDVLENNDYKSPVNGTQNRNALYWAAKYGGFDADSTELAGGTPAIRSRSQWTNDATGSTSISAFSAGVPKTYAEANNPEKMVTALSNAFNNIASTSDTPSQTALGVSQNSGSMVDATASDKAVLLQSSYKRNDYGWQGDVIASEITASGYDEIWKLSEILEGAYRNQAAKRNVWTTAGGSVLKFSSGNASTISPYLSLTSSSRVTGNAANLINYVLGDSSYEGESGEDVFRKRPSDGMLGTVVNSTVNVLPAPTAAACSNSNGLSALQNRGTVYSFAANDGMLHVVDADGNEKFAYLPSTVLSGLKNYAAVSTKHLYLNDGSPVSGELCLNNTQTSVIVGTTGRGGNAVYAVNASKMGMSDYVASADDVLWEFTQSDDADLGLTVHQPEIATILQNGSEVPVAVVSGGYNAANNKGYLYVLKMGSSGTWTLNSNYWKIPLGASGVGAPKTVDTDGDGSIDRIYVGDESGKLWRVDFNGSTWTSSVIFSGSQPITGAPDVIKHGSYYVVIFVTGQYFDNDYDSSVQNYAYGLFDQDGSLISADNLLQQSILSGSVASTSSSSGVNTYYVATSNTLQDDQQGWQLTLPKGYIGTDDAYIRRQKIAQFFVFSGEDTDTSNVCSSSGTSAVIEVNLLTGGLYSSLLFDTNNDSAYDSNDVAASMMISSSGMAFSRTNITVLNAVGSSSRDRILWVDENGVLNVIDLKPVHSRTSLRRISWREVFMKNQ